MKQTAVEWLINEMHKKEQGLIETSYNHLFDKAKEMENKQKGYSEEEVEDIAKDAYAMGRKGILIGVFNKWFEQFKNK